MITTVFICIIAGLSSYYTVFFQKTSEIKKQDTISKLGFDIIGIFQIASTIILIIVLLLGFFFIPKNNLLFVLSTVTIGSIIGFIERKRIDKQQKNV